MSNAEKSLKSELPKENSNVASWNTGFGGRHSDFTRPSSPLPSPRHDGVPHMGARRGSIARYGATIFWVDGAEAVFKLRAVTGPKLQHLRHVDFTTRERPINPGRLQDIQFKSAR